MKYRLLLFGKHLTIERQRETSFIRYYPCLANFKDRFVFIIGKSSAKVAMRYSFAANNWDPTPPMHCLRQNASACTLADYVYVFGGWVKTTCHNTIERLGNPGALHFSVGDLE